MKKKFRWFVRLLCFALVSLLPLMMAACESDGGDDPDTEPVAISGDSQLTMQNLSGDATTVYFDGDYIGTVDAKAAKTWDVPTGTHTIHIDNAEKDNSEGADKIVDFVAGQNHIIQFDWED